MRRHHGSHSRPKSTTTTTTTRTFVRTQMTTSSGSPSGTDMMTAFLQQRPSTTELLGQNVAASMEALVQADCVCFDVDSTVIQEEGIDVLADYLGKGKQVAELTKRAMEGGMKFQDALDARLTLLQPSKLQIESCLRDHPFRLTKGIAELIRLLQLQQKDVYLISGGFRIMIEPIAAQLNINPQTHVMANQILFDYTGFYEGFDTNEYTSRDMGKPRAIQSIYDAHAPKYRTIVMIGDGMTDAQSKPPATAFIGFGGVVVRPNVVTAADWFITDFADLIYLLTTYGSAPVTPTSPP